MTSKSIEIVTVPCLDDNYAFLIHNAATNQTALVDIPEADAIQNALTARGWTPTDILITHHHWDHIDGLANLDRTGVRVIGAGADAHRLPALDLTVSPKDVIEVCGLETRVIDVPGHTIGHIAFHIPQANAAFTADSLMAMGCGRLFEGTPDQMWSALSALAALPEETLIYSGHEYMGGNMAFALSLPDVPEALKNRAELVKNMRAQDLPTVPSLLATEMATNPFLRASDARMKKALGMENATDSEVFAEIRKRKDNF